jgi:hypothetical protein
VYLERSQGEGVGDIIKPRGWASKIYKIQKLSLHPSPQAKYTPEESFIFLFIHLFIFNAAIQESLCFLRSSVKEIQTVSCAMAEEKYK